MRLVLLIVGAAFTIGSYAKTVTPVEAVDSLEQKFGVVEGKRRNHTKGMCFSGGFIASQEAQRFTKSPLFNGKKVDVIGRFSHAGGNIHSKDSEAKVFGMALQFKRDFYVHNMAMLNLPYFHVSTPEAFVQRLQGTSPDEFEKANPGAVTLKKLLSSRDNTEQHYGEFYYNSIHSFYVTNNNNIKTPIRWTFYPLEPQDNVKAREETDRDLEKEFMNKLKQNPISFNMIARFPHDTDVIDDAGVQWVTDGTVVNFGQLHITEVNDECEDINFDPMVMSSGFEPSNDPVLRFRSPAYAVSFGKRIAEKSKNK